MTQTVILRDVTKRYRAVQAVLGVSFSLSPGETVALVGHNGAGKTTLLKLMLGLIQPSEGSIEVLGENPAAGEFAARRSLGYLPESVAFNAALTGREVLAFYARLKGVPAPDAMPLLERVGLQAAADRRVGTYSKGMRQRLGLAQALLGHPRLLLLDEPTTGLDPALRLTFYEIVQSLRDGGATVILCSHALTEIEERADRVVIMNRGLMVANGSLDELRYLARLPTRIRVRLKDEHAGGMPRCIASNPGLRRINGHVVEVAIATTEKMPLLRELTNEAAPIEDVDVVQPSLDELYAHFLRAQEAV